MAPRSDPGAPRVLWRGPLTDPSGYAAGGRAFVRGLAELGAAVRVEPQAWSDRTALTRADRALLVGLLDTDLERIDARVEHTPRRVYREQHRHPTPTRVSVSATSRTVQHAREGP